MVTCVDAREPRAISGPNTVRVPSGCHSPARGAATVAIHPRARSTEAPSSGSTAMRSVGRLSVRSTTSRVLLSAVSTSTTPAHAASASSISIGEPRQRIAPTWSVRPARPTTGTPMAAVIARAKSARRPPANSTVTVPRSVRHSSDRSRHRCSVTPPRRWRPCQIAVVCATRAPATDTAASRPVSIDAAEVNGAAPSGSKLSPAISAWPDSSRTRGPVSASRPPCTTRICTSWSPAVTVAGVSSGPATVKASAVGTVTAPRRRAAAAVPRRRRPGWAGRRCRRDRCRRVRRGRRCRGRG